ASPGGVPHLRHRLSAWWQEGKVILPLCYLFDPAADQFDLFCREFATGASRRHALGRLSGSDALVEFRLLGLAGDERSIAAPVGECAVLRIQAQIRLALGLVGAVTGEAAVREDRPDV